MKVGDLVKYRPGSGCIYTGIVVEAGVYTGRKDIKIYWPALSETVTEFSKYLEVVSEV